MSGGQDDVQATIDADNAAWREGPPVALHATGGAAWQHGAGWSYRAANKAAVARKLRKLAELMQAAATDMAAVGMGRGEWPEHSKELHNAGAMAREWAEAIEAEREGNQ